MIKKTTKFSAWHISPLGDYGWREVVVSKTEWDRVIALFENRLGRKSSAVRKTTAKHTKTVNR